MANAKSQLSKILERLPDDATIGDIRLELDDALYVLYVRQEIAHGLRAAREGKTTSHADVKQRFLRHAD